MKKQKDLNEGLQDSNNEKVPSLWSEIVLPVIFSVFLHNEIAEWQSSSCCAKALYTCMPLLVLSVNGELPCHFQTIIDFGCHICHYPNQIGWGHHDIYIYIYIWYAMKQEPSSHSWTVGDIFFGTISCNPII